MQEALFHDPELVQFYDAENGWGDDTRYCHRLAQKARSILDLGCGTGLLAAALGETRDVWGVDPAAAMLDVARSRKGGSSVTWVEADARTIRLGRRFDLVLMTGHAFQCFLADEDMRAEEWREWGPDTSRRHFDLPPHGRIEAWNDIRNDPPTGIVTYDTFYRTDAGRLWMASARIRFAPQELIATCLDQAGLRVDHWLGDWQGRECTATSDEIIPIGRGPQEAA